MCQTNYNTLYKNITLKTDKLDYSLNFYVNDKIKQYIIKEYNKYKNNNK
jgi:hypothetical protein